MSSKKSSGPKPAAIKFKISTLALFGDRENGRESERGIFTINGEMFMSMEPVSRHHAAEINHEMTTLCMALGAGHRLVPPAEKSA